MAFLPEIFVGDEFVNGRGRFVQHDGCWTAALAWDLAQACINAVAVQPATRNIDNWQRAVVDLLLICTCHEFSALPHLSSRRTFLARNQSLAAAIPAAHDVKCNFCIIGARLPSEHGRFLLAFYHINKGGTAVELTLKWDVLAVFAVFAFVGAILLGAF